MKSALTGELLSVAAVDSVTTALELGFMVQVPKLMPGPSHAVPCQVL